MIDWLKIRLPVDVSGCFPSETEIILEPDGEVRRERRTGQSVVGSFDGRIRATECEFTGRLILDGNPSKFFQGHNVFGSDDIFLLAHAMVWRALPQLGLRVYSAGFQSELSCMDVEVMRVDITESYDAGSLANAKSFVRALAESATLTHRGRGALSEGTVYFGKHSRRWALKAYAKGAEIVSKSGKLGNRFPDAERMIQFAQPLLRIELVLRLWELQKRGLDRLSAWRSVDVTALGAEYRSGLMISENRSMSESELEAIPNRLRVLYSSWKSGEDLRKLLSNGAFYRNRAALLKYGIDIAIVQPKAFPNVVPLVRIIEAKAVGVPEWARGTALLFDRDCKKLA